MQCDVVFSGFGGQGALFAGQLLAYAAMDEGKHVTWIPSYGPEMRGGTAHCTVIVSDEEIGSPLVGRPSFVVALNGPSVGKYEPLLASNGWLVFNASLVGREPSRSDIHAAGIRASDEALALGNPRLMNMVMLGAFVETSRVLAPEAIERALDAHLPAHRRDLLEPNRRALRRGVSLARTAVPAA